MDKEKSVLYGVVLERHGCSLEIRRKDGTYYLHLEDDDGASSIPLRTSTAMELLRSSKAAKI
jgi:hypothetical protein